MTLSGEFMNETDIDKMESIVDQILTATHQLKQLSLKNYGRAYGVGQEDPEFGWHLIFQLRKLDGFTGAIEIICRDILDCREEFQEVEE